MRLVSLLAASALATASLTAVAQASTGGPIGYVGLRGSVIETDDGDTTSGSINYDESYNTGWGASAFLGWVLNKDFRFELEAGYRSADLDSVFITRDDFDNSLEGHRFDVGGHADVGAFMGNVYYDIHFLGDIGVLPWIGAGIGGAYIDYNVTEPTVTLAAKDNTWAFAYQFMAGVTVPLADSISGSIGYRFFQTEDFTYVDSFGLGFQTKLTQQSIDVGLQFHL